MFGLFAFCESSSLDWPQIYGNFNPYWTDDGAKYKRTLEELLVALGRHYTVGECLWLVDRHWSELYR